MKALTHDMFALGLIVYVDSLFEANGLFTIVAAVAATILTNLAIDGFGHARVRGVPRRLWSTHSVVTAPVWGGLVWALALVVFGSVLGAPSFSDLDLPRFVFFGMVAGWGHLLLDAMTEGGVFGLGRRRVALAHFSYDNAVLNLGFSAIGLALLAAGLSF